MDEVLNTTRFQDQLQRISLETGQSVPDLQAEARADLKEMATRPGKVTVAAWDRFCRWIARAYRLDFDPEAIRYLRELNQSASLIFLPNHRSYLDPSVLRSALSQFGFPPNNTIGGANLALWPISLIAQRNGTVFMRREFRDDLVYRAVFKRYIAYLIQNKKNLEWYIEGGRTRTGKLRPPRYGVLKYVMDAVEEEQPENEVYVVPTSIIYDAQHEVSAISAEEMGGSKSPESLKWLYQFSRSQSTRLGKAHLRFGEPLSLGDAIDLTRDSEGNPRPRLAINMVAFEVANRINSVTPITPAALVTFALLDNGSRAITITEGRHILEPLMTYIGRRQFPMTGNIDLSSHGLLRDSIMNLVNKGVVNLYEGGKEQILYIDLEHQHEAAFYRNTIIHFFVNRAITELAVLKALEDDVDDLVTAVWENARRLKDLLKFEFFFPRTEEFAEQIADECSLIYPDWEKGNFTKDDLKRLLRDEKLLLSHRVVGPFLESYALLAEELAKLDDYVRGDEDQLVTQCIGVAKQMWLQQNLHSAESISKDYFKNAYSLVENLGLIGSGQPGLQKRRQEFATEMHQLVERISRIRNIDQENRGHVNLEEDLAAANA